MILIPPASGMSGLMATFSRTRLGQIPIGCWLAHQRHGGRRRDAAGQNRYAGEKIVIRTRHAGCWAAKQATQESIAPAATIYETNAAGVS